MSEATSTVGAQALRIVLFGMPDAGKSSLLGALAQASQTQEHLLNGRLTDLSHGLGELQHRVYEDHVHDTLEEVVPYPVVFEPFSPAGSPVRRQEAVFIDCDGRVANELLSRRRSLEDGHSEKNLAFQVLDADALLLVEDASASPVQMEADFAEFGRFLRLLQHSRGRRSEVGGLPVFLVLTKCDLLAKADDPPATWMARIEERKQQIKERFQDYLANETKAGPLAFGSIDLHPAATAVKYPSLAGSPAKPREPFGVAEVFRQSLENAQAHQQRERASSRRLGWTVAGSAGFVAALVALAVSLFNNQQTTRPTPLESRVEIYRSNEDPSVSARLREPLQRKISALTEIKNDPDFAKLPVPLQDYVNDRLQELQDYRAYKEKLQQARAPDSARSERDLDEIKARLEDELAPPAQYRTEWAQTEAVLFRKQRLQDIQALRDAAGQVEKWYRGLKQRGDELWSFADPRSDSKGPLPWEQWQSRVRRLLTDADAQPFRRSEFIPGSRTIMYAVVFRFDRVEDARGDWEKVRGRLEELQQLAAALGLTLVFDRPALLNFEDKPVGLKAAWARFQGLKEAYPNYVMWPRLPLPEAVASEIRRSAGDRYQLLLPAGREAILHQLQVVSPDGKETPERWRAVREWLTSTRELDGWRELAALLARLHNPKAEGPVDALLAFLNQDRFEIELDDFNLLVPDDWKARPVGNLTLYYRPAEETKLIAYAFTLRGEGRHDAGRRLTEYTYRRDGRALILYRPGDSLWAELPLNKDAEGRDRRFVWRGSRSLDYQFERLSQPPRIERKDQKEGEIAKGVQLIASPENAIPKVPDLMPAVILRKR